MTPTDSFADYTALAQLPKVKLKVTSSTERKGEDSITHVTLENPSKSLAFFVRLKVDKGAKGEEILPVVWEDNYISLLPGEKREVTATYRASELGAAKASSKSNRLERGVRVWTEDAHVGTAASAVPPSKARRPYAHAQGPISSHML